jgi:hypothetical protein
MPEDIYDVSKYVGTAEGCEKGLSRLDARNIEIGKEIQSLKDEQGRLTEATVVIERALAFHNQSAEKLSLLALLLRNTPFLHPQGSQFLLT